MSFTRTARTGTVRNARGQFVKVTDVRNAIDAASFAWINGERNGKDSRNGSELATLREALWLAQSAICPQCGVEMGPVKGAAINALQPILTSPVRIGGAHSAARPDGATYLAHRGCAEDAQLRAELDRLDFIPAASFVAPQVVIAEPIRMAQLRKAHAANRDDLAQAHAAMRAILASVGYVI